MFHASDWSSSPAVASGHTAPYVEGTDLALFPSVVDVAGLNSVSRAVLTNAGSPSSLSCFSSLGTGHCVNKGKNYSQLPNLCNLCAGQDKPPLSDGVLAPHHFPESLSSRAFEDRLFALCFEAFFNP
jgi:hypothetical protein